MSSPLVFGILLGVFQTIATLVIYACGLHSAPDVLAGGHRFENIAAFALMMAAITYGLHLARRARHLVGLRFRFALGAKLALVIAGVGGVLNGLGQYAYVALINPAYSDHFREFLVSSAALSGEEAAVYASQLEFATSAVFRGLNQGLTTLFFGLMVGLAYAFLFRDRVVVPDPARGGPN